MEWIFGYGSLMWTAGFDCLERRPAVLKGYRRRYAMISTRNRGTRRAPGLVLSLVPGGEVRGMALRFDPAREASVLAYLDDREGRGRAHQRVIAPIWLGGAPAPGWLPCYTYLPILSWEFYDGALSLERQAALVAAGKGKFGTSLDYLERLLVECNRLEVPEPELERLLADARRLNGRRGAAD
jgi:cation transport protein ChaC